MSTARALARAALAAAAGSRRTDSASPTARSPAVSPPSRPLRPVAAAVTVLALGALTALGAADATGDLLRLLEPVPA